MLVATFARADTVVVHVVGDGRSLLERAPSQAGAWSVVCFAPCRTTVPRDGWYRVIGARHVSPLRLPEDAIDVTLGEGASDDYGGLLAAGLGAFGIFFGGTIAGIGAFDPTGDGFGVLATGGAIAGAGLVALVVGLLYHYELRPSRLHAAEPRELQQCASAASLGGITIPF